MIKEESDIRDWCAFEEKISKLYECRQASPTGEDNSSNEYLFRGQGNASWDLETTLDRFSSKPLSLQRYFQLASMAKPRIETFTGRQWPIPTRDEYDSWLASKPAGLTFHDYEAYEYLAYLRHHGFPSPLLDWTQSPYVAAFFAFRNTVEGVDKVAVYAYQGSINSVRQLPFIEPGIHKLGAYVNAHKRHFLQQSQYTICTEIEAGSIMYSKHQQVFNQNNEAQDLVWKFMIPVTLKKSFLTQLNRMNINAFSLFGSEDSLVETIVTSEIYLKGRNK
jgi:hypothetical protein